MIEKVISGGQTGADQGGLEGARTAGVGTGGTAPLHFTTEAGSKLELLRGYGLRESARVSYSFRTKENIMNSGGTAIFGNMSSPGSALTLRLCKTYSRAVIINPTFFELVVFVELNDIRVLNIAGNRESVNPGIQSRVSEIVREALLTMKGEHS